MEQSDGPPPKKKLKGVIIGIILFLVGYFGFQQFGSPFILRLFSPSLDKVLMQRASEMNKNCPVAVNTELRMDSTESLPGNIFQYDYTLVNMDKAFVNQDTLKKRNLDGIINGVKTSAALKFYRDNKVTLNYCYRDRHGMSLFTISVTPEIYNQ